jgi:hypothetical protein
VLSDHFILNTLDFHWSQVFIGGEQPEGRYHHAACGFQDGFLQQGK